MAAQRALGEFMFSYQCRLAWRSIKSTPVLSALMVVALAVGIGVFMTNYTILHISTLNPLSYKNDRLFMLQTDAWHLREEYKGTRNTMPNQLSYRDAQAFFDSKIPQRQTIMFRTGGTLVATDAPDHYQFVWARVVTRDFFTLFDETFLYGGPWEPSADTQQQPQVILAEETNQRLFNGANSLGKTMLFEGHTYTVVGVTRKSPGRQIKMQNVELGTLKNPDQAYFPFGIVPTGHIGTWGPNLCPDDTRDYGQGIQKILTGSCLWLTYWAEFSNPLQKQQFETFVHDYIEQQKTLGFYPRPNRFALSNASDMQAVNGYSQGPFYLYSLFGFGFLGICTLNCIALLLAKFARQAPEQGIRRALGASQGSIFAQFLLESVFIGGLAGVIGLAGTLTALELLRAGYQLEPQQNGLAPTNFPEVFTPDLHVVMLTLALAIVASVCAGLYPAWRTCRTPPALYLKQP